MSKASSRLTHIYINPSRTRANCLADSSLDFRHDDAPGPSLIMAANEIEMTEGNCEMPVPLKNQVEKSS